MWPHDNELCGINELGLQNNNKEIKEETSKSSTLTVTCFDRYRHTFSVEDTMDHDEGTQK